MAPQTAQAPRGAPTDGRGAPTLRPHQIAALEAISAARAAGQNRLLLKMPTGTGKTVVFSAMLRWPGLRDWLQTFPAGQRSMLVVAHREELLDQAAAKLVQANPGLLVSVEQGDRHATPHSDVVVASIQTLSAMGFRRLDRLQRSHTFRLVIIDEAHHAAASTYRNVLVRLGFLPAADATDGEGEIDAATFGDVAVMEAALKGWDQIAPQDRLLVGVTATPNRSDAVGLGCVYQQIAYSYALRTAIEQDWLVPITPWVVETTESLDDVRTTHGDFNQRDLADAVNTAGRNRLAVNAWLEHANGRQTIAFSVDVKHAHAIAEAFNDAGIPAAAVSGETPKDIRRQMLADYSAGSIRVIANCMVLTEGTDLPATSCILHAKPTKSATLYEQMTGRGLRIHPGKTECVVIDLVDVARRHSLQASPVLYGLPPGLKTKGDDLRKTADELDEMLAKYPALDLSTLGRVSMADLRVVCSTFDVWTVPTLTAFGAGRALNWLKTAEDVYRLSYPWEDGNETLTVSRDLLGHWTLAATFRPTQGPARQRTLATDILTSDDAAGTAETFVLQHRQSVQRLKATDAPWRKRPASPKQIALLRKLRAPIAAGLTMGQASDMIDLGQARRGRR